LKEQGEASTRMKLKTLLMVIIAVGVFVLIAALHIIWLEFAKEVTWIAPSTSA
jgi:hypothetical protein